MRAGTSGAFASGRGSTIETAAGAWSIASPGAACDSQALAQASQSSSTIHLYVVTSSSFVTFLSTRLARTWPQFCCQMRVHCLRPHASQLGSAPHNVLGPGTQKYSHAQSNSVLGTFLVSVTGRQTRQVGFSAPQRAHLCTGSSELAIAAAIQMAKQTELAVSIPLTLVLCLEFMKKWLT